MSAKPTRRRRTLGVLVAVCLAVLLSSVPGIAAANTTTVMPIVDCARMNPDGTRTVVLGYINPTDSNKDIPHGQRNKLIPAKLQGAQPTAFLRGTQQGAFSVVVAQSDIAAGASWTLDGNVLNYASAASTAAECAPSTPLPAIGNGTGLAVALVGGGVFGVFFVRRLVRRSAAAG